MGKLFTNLLTGAANKALVGAVVTGGAAIAAPGLGEIVDAVAVLFGLSADVARAVTVIASAVIGLVGVYVVPNKAA